MNPKPGNFDEYFALFPPNVQVLLEQMRQTIQTAAPQAQETISYQMPTYWLEGPLVHFAAYPNHIGFYPGPDGVALFNQKLSGYKTAKGSIQFPIGQPLPLEAVAQIVALRVAQNMEKARLKKEKKKTN